MRAPLQGVRQIIRFNWPFYVTATAVILIALSLGGPWLQALAAATAYLTIASLAASYWVYDHSDLYHLTWLPAALPTPCQQALNLHAGLDEFTPLLRAHLPQTHWQTADFYNPAEMTEPSIARARTAGAAPLDYRHWPYPDASLDAVLLLFAAHEIRHPAGRRALFAEAARCLRPGGRILVLEHLRDLPNLAVYGPGAFHFFSRQSWKASWPSLALKHEHRLTPFTTLFILEKPC
jgi:SAM-dependent methyltransferase